MSLKEWLVRVLSQRERLPQATVDAVVKHQYDEASQALKTNNSVEISGFGKFVYNKNKAAKEFTKLTAIRAHNLRVLAEEGLSEKRRLSYEKKLHSANSQLELLKTKL